MRTRLTILLATCCLALVCLIPTGTSWGTVVPEEPSRFDSLVIYDPSTRLGMIAERPDAITGFDQERAGWETFIKSNGGKWQVYIDRRSGCPMLAEGQGIRWFSAEENGVPQMILKNIETKARSFVSANSALFRIKEGELVINPAGSGPIDKDHWILLFDRTVKSIPVEDQRFIMYITRGNLVAFGADRWGALEPQEAVLSGNDARNALFSYMGLTASDLFEEIEPARLVYVSAPPEAFSRTEERSYRGTVGQGIDCKLSWRFAIRVQGERGTWIGKVDARTGEVIAFYDDTKYTQIKGGVIPMSNDGQGWEGTEQDGFPMPFADVTINGSTQYSDKMGLFAPGPSSAQAVTDLNGEYIYIYDVCGPLEESRDANVDLDMLSGTGTDCDTPHRSDSLGDTHTSRTAFYHINRAKERERYWLPDNTWAKGRLQVYTNQGGFDNCNANYSGRINLYRSQKGKCRNLGEISAVEIHEWGHGMDQNDGGGYDDPSEAYSDTVAFLYDRVSCIGRGAWFENCGGYGNTCLNCTGVRDQDWDMRADHIPSTGAGFAQTYCPGGSSPCGKEEHCEGYIAGETIWDLAARDLPASGIDSYSSFQLTEKLFYKSRKGSGGNAYNCAIPNSDGCNAGSWFTKLRTIDDDDGNLSNGTPHAAAIFTAFSRHKIACGAAGDASNQSTSTCPTLAAPAATAAAGCSSVRLSWSAVPDAARYLILRSDLTCNGSSIIIGSVEAPDNAYIDYGMPAGFTSYYRIQAQGTNTACESAVSPCVTIAANAGALTQEVAGLTVTKTATTHLSWTLQADATRYDVAGGMLSELLIDKTFTRAACLANDLASNSWDDNRPNPAAGECYYYLVRSGTSCGHGTYGYKSNGNERIIDSCQ